MLNITCGQQGKQGQLGHFTLGPESHTDYIMQSDFTYVAIANACAVANNTPH